MEHRQLGHSGLMVPVLALGTGTFHPPGVEGRSGNFDSDGARRMVDAAIDHGITLFDTASSYGGGGAEALLGSALRGRRDKVLISTKAGFPTSPGPNELGLSRHHLTACIEESLRRLATDYIDIFQVHCYDSMTPAEETLSTLQGFVNAGKIRYIGVSNFSGWQLMKALAAADRAGASRYVVQQVYYSLLGRDFEHDLMALGLDQGVGTIVWSPLGWGRLTGKIRRGSGLPETSRLHTLAEAGPPVDEERLFRVMDALDEVATETGKLVPQIAINWLLRRPTVSSVIVGARDEAQLRQNVDAVGWSLTAEQVSKLEAASFRYPLYPYWHQRMHMAQRIATPV